MLTLCFFFVVLQLLTSSVGMTWRTRKMDGRDPVTGGCTSVTGSGFCSSTTSFLGASSSVIVPSISVFHSILLNTSRNLPLILLWHSHHVTVRFVKRPSPTDLMEGSNGSKM